MTPNTAPKRTVHLISDSDADPEVAVEVNHKDDDSVEIALWLYKKGGTNGVNPCRFEIYVKDKAVVAVVKRRDRPEHSFQFNIMNLIRNVKAEYERDDD